MSIRGGGGVGEGGDWMRARFGVHEWHPGEG